MSESESSAKQFVAKVLAISSIWVPVFFSSIAFPICFAGLTQRRHPTASVLGLVVVASINVAFLRPRVPKIISILANPYYRSGVGRRYLSVSMLLSFVVGLMISGLIQYALY
jgi:hypothetical protein